MAVAFILDFDGGTIADYDYLLERGRFDGRLPEGALYHAAGATSGGLRVCDVWESADAFVRFAAATMKPPADERGMSPPRIQSFECHMVRGPGGPPAFVQIVRVPGLDAAGFESLDAAVLGPERTVPDGCLFHVNGPLDDGWCVLDFWASKAQRDAFMEASVEPAMEAAGVDQAPTIEELEVHNSLTEPARPAGVS